MQHTAETRSALRPDVPLERQLIDEFLQSKGTTLQEARRLPPEEYSQLMRQAVTYAALRLAEFEARARLLKLIHAPRREVENGWETLNV